MEALLVYERRSKGFSSKQLPRVKKCRGRVGVGEVLRDLYMVINATACIQKSTCIRFGVNHRPTSPQKGLPRPKNIRPIRHRDKTKHKIKINCQVAPLDLALTPITSYLHLRTSDTK